jgi:hypothetical protein
MVSIRSLSRTDDQNEPHSHSLVRPVFTGMRLEADIPANTGSRQPAALGVAVTDGVAAVASGSSGDVDSVVVTAVVDQRPRIEETPTFALNPTRGSWRGNRLWPPP